ncbi:MAG: histidine kinase N-terminal 7TM domain-containing protein [Candidatus Omnitrophica bacterium]|nr:histidine kinase N-terminal 7TM domain-containing protein [Candidatus Omnitrophota bacterium]
MMQVDLSVKIYVWTALLTAITSVLIAVFVYIKNRKLMLNKLWALFSLLTACWSFCYYKWSALPDNYSASLAWNRWGNLFAIIIPAVFLHFTLYLTGQIKEKKKILFISYPIAAAIFISALIYPQHFIRSLVPKVNFSNYPEGGIIFLLFFTLEYFILMAYSLYLSFAAFKNATGLKRDQIKYTWIGMIVGIGGASTNFFPMFYVPIYPIGNIFVGLYPLVIAYAIIRYRLMEIDTVAHKTLLWVLTLLVVILPIGIAVTLSFERISALDRIFKLTFASGVLIFFVWYYGKLKPRVDHFFRRKKYDYYQILGEIGQKIGSELDINRVAGRLFKEIKDVLYIRNGLILVQAARAIRLYRNRKYRV